MASKNSKPLHFRDQGRELRQTLAPKNLKPPHFGGDQSWGCRHWRLKIRTLLIFDKAREEVSDFVVLQLKPSSFLIRQNVPATQSDKNEAGPNVVYEETEK